MAIMNLNDTVPAAPGGHTNVAWQKSGDDVSANVPTPATGDVVGPASATDGHLAVFDGATGKLVKNGGPAAGGVTVTTKGDVQTFSTVAASLAVGADGKVLTADSTKTTGLDWKTPSNVAFPGSVTGLARWFAADALTGFSDGDAVNSWPDAVSGYAGSGSGTIPLYKTNILNGKPVVRFAGAGSYKITAPFDEGEFSFFLVLKITSLANAYTGILGAGWASDLGGYFVKSNGKTAFYLGGTSVYDGTGSATLGTTTFYVLSGIIGPTKGNTRVALAADVSNATAVPATGNRYLLLGDQKGGARIFTGDIAEVLIYGRALSNADRDTIENYLKTKYGL